VAVDLERTVFFYIGAFSAPRRASTDDSSLIFKSNANQELSSYNIRGVSLVYLIFNLKIGDCPRIAE
jgi:hypothetical protein